MNNKLEDCVREGQNNCSRKNRILQMLIEDADITEILRLFVLRFLNNFHYLLFLFMSVSQQE
jgi:hypothetical protein